MSEFREFQDGELIAATRYRVLGLIGVGGMGSVYEVEHTELGKRFVLKALLRELSRRDDLVQRLRNEWRALARLQHANIVNVTDAGTSGGGVPFYVMERLDGDTLAALLRQKRRLHVLEAVNIAVCVLDALSAAHEIGIIHRDVKPANVFVVNGGAVKLLDFGIAKIANATGVVTARGLAVGTPRYMSPEQARGERVDGRSDIYAAALILFEMIAGVGPFDDVRDANELLIAHMAREAPPLSALVNGVSPELERILANMLAKDCRQRPAHAREAATQLRHFALRQRLLPATDAPTARADYGAETVPAAQPRQALADSVHESITRPEGALRKPLSPGGNPTDDRTQPMSLAPETTQVTVSANTGEAFSISSVPNTTYVSRPSFDGTTTLKMSTLGTRPPSSMPPPSPAAVERPERTERLGEFPPPAMPELADTRTQLPVPERARPPSITPPPVVDLVRAESWSRSGSAQRAGRWAALIAAGLGALLATGFVVRRAAVPSESASTPVAAAPTAARGAPLQDTSTPANALQNGTPAAAETRGLAAAAPSAAPAPVPSSGLVAPAASASARNFRMISDAKHLSAPALARRTPAPGTPFPASIARVPAPRPSAPVLPASGL